MPIELDLNFFFSWKFDGSLIEIFVELLKRNAVFILLKPVINQNVEDDFFLFFTHFKD